MRSVGSLREQYAKRINFFSFYMVIATESIMKIEPKYNFEIIY